jgi:hypothetical protein
MRVNLALAALALMLALAAPIGADYDPLVESMNSFAKEYNAFADQLRIGIFDVRSARELSRRWKRVEHSEDWPK